MKILIDQLKALDLPEGEFVVVGSAAMAARGIREAKDLDVLVSSKLWEVLARKYPVSQKACMYISVGDVELLGPGSMYRDPEIITTDDVIGTAEIIDGIPYINLGILKRVKKWRADPKDFRDIELIDKYLDTTSLR